MAAMELGCLGKVTATVFTTVLAPVLVHYLVQDLTVSPAAGAGGNLQGASVQASRPSRHEIIITHGLGINQAAARREALRSALLKIIASLLGTKNAGKAEQTLCETLLQEPTVVIRCEELGCHKEMSSTGTFFCQEMMVEVSRDALAGKLQAGGLRVSHN